MSVAAIQGKMAWSVRFKPPDFALTDADACRSFLSLQPDRQFLSNPVFSMPGHEIKNAFGKCHIASAAILQGTCSRSGCSFQFR